MLDFEALAKEIYEYNGASVSISGKKPTRGYMVSDRGCKLLFDHVPNSKELKQYKRNYISQLSKVGSFLGAWVDFGKCYLDVSRCISSKSKALAIARKNKQLAMFDLSNFESISTGK